MKVAQRSRKHSENINTTLLIKYNEHTKLPHDLTTNKKNY